MGNFFCSSRFFTLWKSFYGLLEEAMPSSLITSLIWVNLILDLQKADWSQLG